MGFQLKDDEYYIIRQNVEGYKSNQYQIENCDEESIIKLTRILAGTISVYIYNSKTNTRIDKTSELGRKHRHLDLYRIISCYHIFFRWKENPWNYFQVDLFNALIYVDIFIYIINDEKKAYLRTKYGKEYKYLTICDWKLALSRRIEQKQNTESNIIKGEAYEEFIGKKYEEKYKNVIYNGIEKKKKDNGIDLIIEDDNRIIFVQCKNWISTEWNKLTQKDLRAFIGDCFIHITKNNITKKTSFHFIVSDENLLTDSAKIFIKNNSLLKYKIVPFSEKNN